MSIVGVGVDQEDLLQFVKKYFNKVGSGNGPSIEKAKFHGGKWPLYWPDLEGNFKLTKDNFDASGSLM